MTQGEQGADARLSLLHNLQFLAIQIKSLSDNLTVIDPILKIQPQSGAMQRCWEAIEAMHATLERVRSEATEAASDLTD